MNQGREVAVEALAVCSPAEKEGDSIRDVERWIMCWDVTELDEFLDCLLRGGG